MNYLFWTLVHIAGVFGVHYAGILWFLVPSLLHIITNMFVFVFGVSAALTPGFGIKKLERKSEQEFGYRFLLQIAIILTAVQLFNIGYPFFAGMVVLQGTVLALSVILQKIFDKEE